MAMQDTWTYCSAFFFFLSVYQEPFLSCEFFRKGITLTTSVDSFKAEKPQDSSFVRRMGWIIYLFFFFFSMASVLHIEYVNT